ncbi:MAG: hypothetical protein R2799_09185 [Crocinitomicaceae bacterium]
MKKKVLFVFLVTGILLLAMINVIYSNSNTREFSQHSSKIDQMDIAVSANGFFVFGNPTKNRLVDISSSYSIKMDSGYVLTNEINSQADLMNDLFNYSELRKKQKPKKVKTTLVPIQKTAEKTVYRIKPESQNDLAPFLDVFYFQMANGTHKFKIQNNGPFTIKNKKVSNFKCYQIELEKESVHNAEIIYKQGDTTYRLMIQAVWTI